MMEITNCPSCLSSGYTTYSPKAAKQLFNGEKVNPVLGFDFAEFQDATSMVEAMYRISVSGVQEKFPAVIEKGNIRLAHENERSTYILKPAPWDKTLQNRKQIPANEHLTMQIASQVYGIQTACNGLCFTPSGAMVYITKRFDVFEDGTKAAMEDFAAAIGRNEQTDGKHFKYNGCYEDIAMAIRRNVAAWMVDMERFFELMVFNYIYANGDAHLKNFSLIRQGNDYRLSPAYDLLNTCLHVNGDDFGLDGGLSPHVEQSDVMDRTGHPCHVDFERFAERIGIRHPRIQRIVTKFKQLPPQVQVLIDHSYLNDKMKRTYLRVVNERISRFVRVSE